MEKCGTNNAMQKNFCFLICSAKIWDRETQSQHSYVAITYKFAEVNIEWNRAKERKVTISPFFF